MAYICSLTLLPARTCIICSSAQLSRHSRLRPWFLPFSPFWLFSSSLSPRPPPALSSARSGQDYAEANPPTPPSLLDGRAVSSLRKANDDRSTCCTGPTWAPLDRVPTPPLLSPYTPASSQSVDFSTPPSVRSEQNSSEYSQRSNSCGIIAMNDSPGTGARQRKGFSLI